MRKYLLLILVGAIAMAGAGRMMVAAETPKSKPAPKIESSESSPGASLAGITSTGAEQNLQNPVITMVQGLCLCLGIVMLGVWGYRKVHGVPSAGNRRMKVVERLSISPKASLVLVEIEGNPMLLALGSDQVRQLQPMPSVEQHQENFEEYICRNGGALHIS